MTKTFRRYVREFQVLNSLWKAGFPVPRAYLCECDSLFFDYPFIIMRDEGGTNKKIDEQQTVLLLLWQNSII